MSLPIICECPTKNKQGNPLIPPTGQVQLIKLEFVDTVDIYSDEVDDKTKDHVLYKIKGESDFHWVKNDAIYEQQKLPYKLPVSIHSREIFIIKAYFQVSSKLNTIPKIAISLPEMPEYLFENEHLDGKSEGEFELIFKAKNTPYENQILYVSDFHVSFCYQNENDDWIPAGCSINKLYMTWNKPSYNYGAPRCESLFYLSCKQGYKSKTRNATISDDEWNKEEIKNIADSIFSNLSKLNTRRVNETFPDGMGYWRGVSALNGDGGSGESLNNFIADGEGTCGNWSALFIALLVLHGFEEANDYNDTELKSLNIYTPIYSSDVVFVGQQKSLIKRILHKAKILVGKKEAVIKRDSSDDKSYIDYNELVPCLFMIKNWQLESNTINKYPPKQLIPSRAQGNSNPLSLFRDHVFVVIRTPKGAYWYDPSYGLTSEQSFNTSKRLVKHYARTVMSGILAAARPKENSSGSKMKENSSGLYIDLFSIDTFNSKNMVSPYVYYPIGENLEGVMDYKFEQYKDTKEEEQYVVQLELLKTYNIEYLDFKRIKQEYGYDIKVEYENNQYRYYILPFENDIDAVDALSKARNIFPACFRQKINF